jgi:hypothetical protein
MSDVTSSRCATSIRLLKLLTQPYHYIHTHSLCLYNIGPIALRSVCWCGSLVYTICTVGRQAGSLDLRVLRYVVPIRGYKHSRPRERERERELVILSYLC